MSPVRKTPPPEKQACSESVYLVGVSRKIRVLSSERSDGCASLACMGVKIDMPCGSRRLVQEVESNEDVANNVNMETVTKRAEKPMEDATYAYVLKSEVA